jgi:hypothetical protein
MRSENAEGLNWKIVGIWEGDGGSVCSYKEAISPVVL